MNISYHRYGLRLRGGSGGNARSQRRVLEGFLIRADGGYGCVQPWPELGDETLEAQWQALQSGGKTRLLERALECAAADGAARREGRSLFAGLRVPESHATVTGGADFALLQAEGFTTVKLKGGRDWEVVLERMREAVAAGLRVRVDFNGVLDGAGFLSFAQSARDVRMMVDFVEDPVPYAAEVWRRLRSKTGWRLALDQPGGAVVERDSFDVRVRKPAVEGLARSEQEAGEAETVITSYMDHPVGQAFAAWEAGKFGDDQGLAGLLTHRLFERDVFTDQLASAGPKWVGPGGTGLGFDELLEGLSWIPLGDGGKMRAGRVMQNARDLLPEGGPVLEEGQVGFATSGSTGCPSVVVHTEETLAASARAVNGWLGARAEDVWLRVLPDFHVGGWQIGVRAGLAGSRVVADEGKWEVTRFVRMCEVEGVTLTALVPTQVVDLVQQGLAAPVGLRAVLVGGGNLEEAWAVQAARLGWPVRRSYGMTEAGSQVATEVVFGEGDGADRTEGMVVLPHWEARVAEDGTGLLELRGAALAQGRFVREGAVWVWQRMADEAGWWRTADRVFLSGRRLCFAGRMDRVVKVLGELVNLDAVEERLAEAGLRVGTFVVVAVAEVRRGMELVVVIEQAAAREGAAVGRAAVAVYHLTAPPFARVGRVVPVGSLPRSPLGKVRYGAAAALIPPRAVPE